MPLPPRKPTVDPEQFAALCEALREAGHTIPEEVRGINDVIIAIKAGINRNVDLDDEDVNLPDDRGAPAGTVSDGASMPMLS